MAVQTNTGVEIVTNGEETTKRTTIRKLQGSERKNSSSDLQSRLKARKMLGVGEMAEDGGIYRSKLSQVLGFDEHLYLTLPRGYLYWEMLNMGFLLIYALLCICIPKQIVRLETSSTSSNQNCDFLVRLYGSSVLGFAFLLKKGADRSREGARVAISNSLSGAAIFFILQFIASISSSISKPSVENLQVLLIMVRLGLGVGNFIYYQKINPSRNWQRMTSWCQADEPLTPKYTSPSGGRTWTYNKNK